MRKKGKRSFRETGKLRYNFDFSLEKKIYGYVSMETPQKRYSKIPKKYQFTKYTEWKSYVQNNYIESNTEQLENFLHYLEYALKRRKPEDEYYKMVISATIANCISQLVQFLISINASLVKENIVGKCIGQLLAVIVIFPLIFCFIWNTIGVISQSNMEDNMLKDYIDIIQDMLNKKRQMS